MAYDQKKSVSDRPNPPTGKYSMRHDRPEGYADYKPNMIYIVADYVQIKRPTTSTTTTRDKKSRIDMRTDNDELHQFYSEKDISRVYKILKNVRHGQKTTKHKRSRLRVSMQTTCKEYGIPRAGSIEQSYL